MPTYARSLAPNPIPLASLGRLPLYRIRVPPDFLDLLVGAILGNRYVVLCVLGRGGMSVVYKAKEMKTGKIVAVKTLRTQSLTDEMVVKRFQREAELLSRLNHPRIVNLHAYGTSARGQPYFVMDYLVGENIVDVLKREDHIEPERFQDIFVQVCAAIEHAHKHGAIHRDIKPGNIMLTRTKSTKDYVKVVDFGIAKLAEEAQKLTRMGEVWGSPIYMSPEQCMGATIDARSDIYSLGIVMYECLTGRVPFLGRNYADTMGKQISETPTPFATMSPELKIPASLEAIVMTAIEKDPAARYQTLTQMRKDLEGALTAQPGGAITIPPKLAKGAGKATTSGDMLQPGSSGGKHRSVPSKKETNQSIPKIDNKNLKASTQSKANLKQPTLPDIERPRPTTTRNRMDAASVDSSRMRNLILIAVASLIVSGSLIAAFTHGDKVFGTIATVLKQFISESGDAGSEAQNDGLAPQTQTTSTQDPQKALEDFIGTGSGAGTTETGAGSGDANGTSIGTSTNTSTQDQSDQNPLQIQDPENQIEQQKLDQSSPAQSR